VARAIQVDDDDFYTGVTFQPMVADDAGTKWPVTSRYAEVAAFDASM